jgi:hypothetical protein
MPDEFGELEAECSILPAWFVPRMMGDVWSFALLTTDRVAILISTITSVDQAKDGSIWLTVDLLRDDDFWALRLRERGWRILTAPTSRTTASINASLIVAALEIADT